MPHGSSGPPSIPISNNINLANASPPPRSSLAAQRSILPTDSDATMKTKVFGPASPTTARPKTGHQSIRGLRISGPIPMTSTNPIEDDEFPIRNPGTGIASATPLDSEPVPQHASQQTIPTLASPVTQTFSPVAQSVATPVRADTVDVPQTVPEHPGSPSPHPYTRPHGSSGPSPEGGASSAASAARSSPARYQRTNPSTNTRFSTLSINSGKTGDTSAHDVSNSPPQRKKSTLRSALSKFLRRKKKDGSLSSVSETDRQSALGGPPQHRSVPPAARLEAAQQIEPAKRVASMPVNEFDRALRSHSVGPDDITAIESARNSLSFDALASSPSRRRATTATNSKLYLMMAPNPRSRGEEWAGLSPRPASTHARGSRFTEADPEEIGRALTSDNGGENGHKRRSRSLSQLYEVAHEQKESRRRSRSDEIRFWRESYDVPGPLSPLSSNPNENETDIGNEDQLEHSRASMSIAESQAADKAPKTPPQPFNFGTLSSMNEMAGMKITQAATLDERLGCLETRVYRLERVVNQLCHSVPGFKGPFMEVSTGTASRSGLQRSGSGAASGSGVHRVPSNQPTYAYSNVVPPMIPSIYQINSRDGLPPSSRRSVETADDNTSSRMSFGEGRTYIDSLHPPSSSATQNQSTTGAAAPQGAGLLRPTSESTVRPATSMPSLGPRASQSSSEDYPQNSAALVAQLESERAARQALEDQVRKLSERLNNLSSTMFAMVRDPAKSKSNERLRPQTATPASAPSNNTHLAPISVNTNRAAPTVDPSSRAQSIFGKDSRFSSVTNSPAVEMADDEFSEAFQTPREEPGSTPNPQQYEPFGVVDEFGSVVAQSPEEGDEDEADLKRKKAARTLSLSQLTMGKGLPTRI
ncbi:hypothetical protein DHEL01_v201698 [Diaporthe helianthi]|uniref:Uncharacterized protein n=1 Tax=Diaporthe helianthi TaxID=158607 RepID=A0A2P5IBN3_DIAHE|nr:hypothetical protein DHEL01_v201698 [Diaporthe helianthi]